MRSGPGHHQPGITRWLSDRWRFLRRLLRPGDPTEQHIREESTNESFPYLVEHDVPSGFALPAGFHCGKFRGLRYCEILMMPHPPPPGATAAKVVSFWRDRESFDHQVAAFQSALGGPPLLWQGYQSEVDARARPKWWKNAAAVYLVAVHTVAVLGTVEALRSHYAELFGPGDVHVYAPDPQYDVMQGQSFRLTYRVRNIGSAKSALSLTPPRILAVTGGEPPGRGSGPPDCARLRTTASASSADPGLTLGDDVREIPDITVGEIEEITVSGLARRAGRYCLAIDGAAESGVVRRLVFGDSTFHTDLNVRVWPPFGFTVGLAGVHPDQCLYTVVLSSGAAFPEGVSMRAELIGVADAAFRFVQASEAAGLRRGQSGRGAPVSARDRARPEG